MAVENNLELMTANQKHYRIVKDLNLKVFKVLLFCLCKYSVNMVYELVGNFDNNTPLIPP